MTGITLSGRELLEHILDNYPSITSPAIAKDSNIDFSIHEFPKPQIINSNRGYAFIVPNPGWETENARYGLAMWVDGEVTPLTTRMIDKNTGLAINEEDIDYETLDFDSIEYEHPQLSNENEIVTSLTGGRSHLGVFIQTPNETRIQPIGHECHGMIYETTGDKMSIVGDTNDVNMGINAISNYQLQNITGGGLFDINQYMLQAFTKLGVNNGPIAESIIKSLIKGFNYFIEGYELNNNVPLDLINNKIDQLASLDKTALINILSKNREFAEDIYIHNLLTNGGAPTYLIDIFENREDIYSLDKTVKKATSLLKTTSLLNGNKYYSARVIEKVFTITNNKEGLENLADKFLEANNLNEALRIYDKAETSKLTLSEKLLNAGITDHAIKILKELNSKEAGDLLLEFNQLNYAEEVYKRVGYTKGLKNISDTIIENLPIIKEANLRNSIKLALRLSEETNYYEGMINSANELVKIDELDDALRIYKKFNDKEGILKIANLYLKRTETWFNSKFTNYIKAIELFNQEENIQDLITVGDKALNNNELSAAVNAYKKAKASSKIIQLGMDYLNGELKNKFRDPINVINELAENDLTNELKIIGEKLLQEGNLYSAIDVFLKARHEQGVINSIHELEKKEHLWMQDFELMYTNLKSLNNKEELLHTGELALKHEEVKIASKIFGELNDTNNLRKTGDKAIELKSFETAFDIFSKLEDNEALRNTGNKALDNHDLRTAIRVQHKIGNYNPEGFEKLGTELMTDEWSIDNAVSALELSGNTELLKQARQKKLEKEERELEIRTLLMQSEIKKGIQEFIKGYSQEENKKRQYTGFLYSLDKSEASTKELSRTKEKEDLFSYYSNLKDNSYSEYLTKPKKNQSLEILLNQIEY